MKGILPFLKVAKSKKILSQISGERDRLFFYFIILDVIHLKFNIDLFYFSWYTLDAIQKKETFQTRKGKIMMTITVDEAINLTYAAIIARAEETEKKAEAALNKIDTEIREAATAGMRVNQIGLRSFMVNSDFPDLDMAKKYIAAKVREHGFTAKWDNERDYILTVKW